MRRSFLAAAAAVVCAATGVVAPTTATATPAAGADTTATASHAAAAAAAMSGRAAGRAAARGVTVVVNTTTGESTDRAVRAAVTRLGGRVRASWPRIGVLVAAVPETAEPLFTRRVRRVPGVVSAGLSGRYGPELPRAPRAKATRPAARETVTPIVAAVRGPQANATATGAGVTVGVADSGLFDEHSEFTGRVDTRRSGACTNGGAFRRTSGSWRPGTTSSARTHGTGVASVVAAAADGRGIRGVAPQARIAAIRVVDDKGYIYPEASICSVMAAAGLGLRVVNHSYGVDWAGTLQHGFFDPRIDDHVAVTTALDKAFAYSRRHGVLNIAATGNAGEDQSDKPAIPLPASEGSGTLPARLRAYLAETPGVLGVAESQPDGTVTFMSTVGLGIADLSTVGSGLLANTPNGYQQDGGTSFASPAVAGVAALVAQTLPRATPARIESIVLDSARAASCRNAGLIVSEQPCRTSGTLTSYFGHGYADALAAVRTAAARG